MQIEKHKVVELTYQLSDGQDRPLSDSADSEPLAYLHGVGSILPGLERALHGKVAGDQFQVVLQPEDGFGERNESLRVEVPRSQFQGVDDLATGMQFRVPTDDGELVVTVAEISGETVTVDGNHQLAGRTLHFDVTVLSVRDASAEEIAHGHVHGPGGHHSSECD